MVTLVVLATKSLIYWSNGPDIEALELKSQLIGSLWYQTVMKSPE